MEKLISRNTGAAGFTLPEVIVASAISAVIAAAALVSIVSYQRSLNAIEDSANMHQEQGRLLDFIALDLRRATNLVNTTSTDTNLLELDMPTYSTNPTFSNNQVIYSADATRVRYYRKGSDVIRQEAVGTNSPIKVIVARGVSDFDVSLPDNTGGLINTKITFEPKFRLKGTSYLSSRSGTQAASKTWLRNMVLTAAATNSTNSSSTNTNSTNN